VCFSRRHDAGLRGAWILADVCSISLCLYAGYEDAVFVYVYGWNKETFSFCAVSVSARCSNTKARCSTAHLEASNRIAQADCSLHLVSDHSSRIDTSLPTYTTHHLWRGWYLVVEWLPLPSPCCHSFDCNMELRPLILAFHCPNLLSCQRREYDSMTYGYSK
jgi:hypothetical protein